MHKTIQLQQTVKIKKMHLHSNFTEFKAKVKSKLKFFVSEEESEEIIHDLYVVYKSGLGSPPVSLTIDEWLELMVTECIVPL